MEKGLEAITEQHTTISNGIVDSAEWLDSILVDKPIETKTQKTRLKLSFSLFASESEGVELDGSASFRLSLPMLSERLQLQISDNGDDEIALDPNLNRWPPRDSTERGVIAGLRYFFTRTAKRNSSIKASLRLHDGAPVLLVEPRYRQDFPYDRWLFRFTQRVIGYSNGELQLRTIFNLERPLDEWSPDFCFRSIAEGIWFSERSGYFYHLDFRLLQNLDSRRELEYAWINEFQTVPEHRLEVSRVRLAWRQNIYWDWLFLEVAPQVAFSHERNRKPDPGILLNLEVIFGACDYKNL